MSGGRARRHGRHPTGAGVLARVVRRIRSRRAPVLPHPGPVTGEQRSGGRSGALRAGIFGMNDGLVSNVSLIFGVAGAGVDNEVVIVAGVAGLLAGAFSMAAGEYISVRVQREVFERLIHLEAHEIGTDPDAERAELAELYVRKGLRPDLAGRVADEMMRDPRTALETHAREELGLDPGEGLGSPVAAATTSFATFAIGAMLPLLPFLFWSGARAAGVSAAVSGAALFGVGAAMSVLTGRNAVISGIRMLAIGGAAAGVTYLVGTLLDVGVGL
ncbi:MAG: VIT1/CCC1 transporter family protein [Actinomycetota bacterium]